MSSVVETFRDILLLRRGPQDLPYSTQLLVTVAALSIAAQLPVAWIREISVGMVLVGSALALAFSLGLLRLLLTLRDKGSRFVQTATAFVGCDVAFKVMGIPVALLFGTPPQTAEQMTGAQMLAGLIALPLLIWKVMVDAHVFRHSLDISFGGGISVALMWILAAVALASLSGAPA
ncbi:MAG: hypothetical protein J0I77_14550 [Rudaea sp.]|uniref:hypothetical protein n=1 Tax=unclassified Rudaea TaxID=2627037 RepID=UPI0010F83FE7|nr:MULTISPECIES: hypothetical protein [unclassified Rudaea]MBN8886938.1 hypothetical protein [Rudaea sp.]MBR0346925.1 hypothetical protein [Rudaea sp.]